MSKTKSPMQRAFEQFKDKAGLVAAVEGLSTSELWLGRIPEGNKLKNVSNRKLLRLHSVLSEVKSKFGSRDKLVSEILTAEKRTKDTGYKARLERFPTPRLMDAWRATQK